MNTIANYKIPIYTIGYGNRKIEEFLELLKKYQIRYLIDIRSSPYSKYNPDFSKHRLEAHLSEYDVRYVYMGDTLGGRPSVPSCYTDGKVDYQKLSQLEFYKQGITRLRKAWEQKINVIVLCSEAKPQECHRSKLIGETLIEYGIDVAHIDENGELKTQEEVINELTNGQISFFGPSPKITKSRNKYQQENGVT
jgi:uncharacterized protein (DUF488 family)